MKSSVAPTEQAETVTFLSFCDLCSIIKGIIIKKEKTLFRAIERKKYGIFGNSS